MSLWYHVATRAAKFNICNFMTCLKTMLVHAFIYVKVDSL